MGHAFALGRAMSRADDGNRPAVAWVHAAAHVEQVRRIGDGRERHRIAGSVEHAKAHAVAGHLGQFGIDIDRPKRSDYLGRQGCPNVGHLGQLVGAGLANRAGRAEFLEQRGRQARAETGNEMQGQKIMLIVDHSAKVYRSHGAASLIF